MTKSQEYGSMSLIQPVPSNNVNDWLSDGMTSPGSTDRTHGYTFEQRCLV